MTFVFYTLTLIFLEAKRDERYVLPPNTPPLLSSVLQSDHVCEAPTVPRRPGQDPNWHHMPLEHVHMHLWGAFLLNTYA